MSISRRKDEKCLVAVAVDAGQCEVGWVIGAAVLTGDNVFDVVGCLGVLLADKAILATIPGPPPNQVSRVGNAFIRPPRARRGGDGL